MLVTPEHRLNNGKKETIDSYEMLLLQVLATTHGKKDKSLQKAAVATRKQIRKVER